MNKCISVTLSSGQVISATVDDDVDELPQEDIEALEEYVAYRKARAIKSKTLTREKADHE